MLDSLRHALIAVAVSTIWLTGPPASAQVSGQEALSDRRVAYDLVARLDPDARTVLGEGRIRWRNPDQVPVGELQFHLYLNAFRDSTSTFMKESGGRHRGYALEGADAWGGITLQKLERVAPDAAATGDRTPLAPSSEPDDLLQQAVFIQPDDGNPADQTVLSVPLAEPVQPGETITLDVVFSAKLPRIFARTGWDTGSSDSLFFFVGQWFPKLGVYETPGQRYVPADAPSGAWNTHQFHLNSEFYADFGSYAVTIDVPEHYAVGATGTQSAEALADGRKRLTFRADDVHDFAWVAGADLEVITDSWRSVSLRMLAQPDHRRQALRQIEAVKQALDYADRHWGTYPYATLTIVDALGGSSGMEYPTLITTATFYGAPRWEGSTAMVAVHEFMHQYWYGLVANNEFEEAWLDEGITSYTEARIMDDVFGSGSLLRLAGLRIGTAEMYRLAYVLSDPEEGVIFRNSWDQSSGTYAKTSYTKPATVLSTLEGVLGRETLDRGLRLYFERWSFRHPTTRDFIQAIEEASGRALGWFFDPFVYDDAVLDYAVDTLYAVQDADGAWTSTVRLARRGDGAIPVPVRLSYAGGAEERRTWDGSPASVEWVLEGPEPVAEVVIDPDFALRLDLNRLNNGRRLDADRSGVFELTVRLIGWLQQWFGILSALV